MYINFNKLKTKKINIQELGFLQAVHQQKYEDLEEDIEKLSTHETINRFLEEGIIHYIKGKKGDSEIKKLRTTKKGRNLLMELQKNVEWDEDDEIIIKWLESIYKKRPNYTSGNSSQAKRLLHWFKKETGIVKNELSMLLVCFIKDTYVEDPFDNRSFGEKFQEFKRENPRAQLSNKIENLIWSPTNIFQKNYNLENSPLWKYFKENQQYVEQKWKEI